MAVYKNTASQKVSVYAWDSAAGAPKTGDAANITAQISLDGGTTNATNDTNPTELDATDAKGVYIFDLTQAETNADMIVLSAVSSTGDIVIDPLFIYTDNDPTVAAIADAVWDEAVSGHIAAGSFGERSAFMAYDGPMGQGVWISGNAANTNTVLGVDGTLDNPVSTIAAATTIAGTLNTQTLYFTGASNITLAQAYNNWNFVGVGGGNQLKFGSQSTNNASYYNLILSGTYAGISRIYTHDCYLTTSTNLRIVMYGGVLDGSQSLLGGCVFINCSELTTSGVTFSLGSSSTVDLVSFGGTATIAGGDSSNTVRIFGNTDVVINDTNTSLNVEAFGNVEITDNGTTSVITQNAAVTMSKINTEADTALTDFWTSPATLVDLVWDEVLTGATHNVATSAGRRLRQIQDVGGYALGCIWVDTVNGTAGTTDFENGTVNLPVDTWADALTLSASTGINQFFIRSGSSITLTAATQNYFIQGHGYALALGGQDISGTTIMGSETLSGTATASVSECFIWDSQVGNVWMGEVDFHNCHLIGTMKIQDTEPYLLHRCVGLFHDGAYPILDFGSAIPAAECTVSSFSGGLSVDYMKAGDVLSIDGDMDLTINATCTGGTVYINGNVRLTNNGTGQTIYQDGRMSLTGINAEADTALSDYDPPTNAQLTTAVSAVGLADDAITSAKFDETTAFPVKSADTGATQIARVGADGDTLETLSDEIAATPAGVWAYSSRTITQTAASVASVLAGSTITVTRGDTLTVTLTGLGSVAARSNIWFTLKPHYEWADADSYIQIDTTTGLKYINGTAATTAANGAITIDDEDDGDITITLKPVETAKLPVKDNCYYDVQMLDTSGAVSTLTAAAATITYDTTRATS